MIRLRPYHNSDLLQLLRLWRESGPARGLVQPVSHTVFDDLVLSKPYFDRCGLIVAELHDQLVGFVHAGWGTNEPQTGLSTATGVISLVVTGSHGDDAALADALISAAEDYLHQRGAASIVAGAADGRGPFYLGLYGGSELPGIAEEDMTSRALFQRHGYLEVGCRVLYERELTGLRPIVDRVQMLLRRQGDVVAISDAPTSTWWQACTIGSFELTRFEVQRKDGTSPARVTYWNMEPLSASRHRRISGMLDLQVDAATRRGGWATYLLGESLRQLMTQGIDIVQAQTTEENTAASDLFRKLGFQLIARNAVLVKKC